MTPTLRVVTGGAHPGAAEIDIPITAIGFDAVMDQAAAAQFAAGAETVAQMVAEQTSAAVAILAQSKEQLVSLIGLAGITEALAAQDALREALSGADALTAIFRTARTRLLIASATAAGGTVSQAISPILATNPSPQK
jgi:hypothetical protein